MVSTVLRSRGLLQYHSPTLWPWQNLFTIAQAGLAGPGASTESPVSISPLCSRAGVTDAWLRRELLCGLWGTQVVRFLWQPYGGCVKKNKMVGSWELTPEADLQPLHTGAGKPVHKCVPTGAHTHTLTQHLHTHSHTHLHTHTQMMTWRRQTHQYCSPSQQMLDILKRARPGHGSFWNNLVAIGSWTQLSLTLF